MVAPVIHIGDATIQTTVEQKTYPSLHIMDHTGAVYHVAVRAQDEQLATGTETLVYEQSAINTCETVTLDAGLYRAELRGGSGGLASACNAGAFNTPQLGTINTTIIKLDAPTTISVFRGGDGNKGGVVNTHQTCGGGASGADSLIVLPTRTIRATGGVGIGCSMAANLSGYTQGAWYKYFYYNGGGGGVSDMTQGLPGISVSSGIAAGGGGGAPSGTGGAAATNTTAGSNATSAGGGNGGDATNPNGDSKTSNIGYGGRGGANVTWTCGGQTITSYGGGGGGGACAFANKAVCELYGGTYGDETGILCYSDCANGGDGGSGSTGTSTDSYVKIYRIG